MDKDLFGETEENPLEKEWQGMPEFKYKDKRPFHKLTINFRTKEDILAFKRLFEQVIGQPLTVNTDTIWFPKNKRTPTGIYKDEP